MNSLFLFITYCVLRATSKCNKFSFSFRFPKKLFMAFFKKKLENSVNDLYIYLNHHTESALRDKMYCTCTRMNYGCNYFLVNIFMVLWFPARLLLFKQHGSTTICNWRRRCGLAGTLWSRNTGRSRRSGLVVQGLKKSAPGCLQSMRPSWRR